MMHIKQNHSTAVKNRCMLHLNIYEQDKFLALLRLSMKKVLYLMLRLSKLCAFYFPSDKTKGFAPVANVLEGQLTDGETMVAS